MIEWIEASDKCSEIGLFKLNDQMIIIGLVMFPSFKAGEMEDMVTDSRDDPQTDFIYCFGANTEVLKFGSCQLHSGHKILFLIIPGELDKYSLLMII